jgi:hypothetical protein
MSLDERANPPERNMVFVGGDHGNVEKRGAKTESRREVGKGGLYHGTSVKDRPGGTQIEKGFPQGEFLERVEGSWASSTGQGG